MGHLNAMAIAVYLIQSRQEIIENKRGDEKQQPGLMNVS